MSLGIAFASSTADCGWVLLAHAPRLFGEQRVGHAEYTVQVYAGAPTLLNCVLPGAWCVALT